MNGMPSSNHPIVVPLDGSTYADAALPYAAELAGKERPLALIRVLPDVTPYPILWRPLAATPEAASRRFQDAAMRSLRQKARSCTRAFGEAVTTLVVILVLALGLGSAVIRRKQYELTA